MHKDIKPDNIVIGDNREAVLIDFGVSTTYGAEEQEEAYADALTLKTGTYLYFAPELFNMDVMYTYGPATDIWALGITFFYLLTGYHPFEGVDNIAQLMSVMPTREINFDSIKNE